MSDGSGSRRSDELNPGRVVSSPGSQPPAHTGQASAQRIPLHAEGRCPFRLSRRGCSGISENMRARGPSLLIGLTLYSGCAEIMPPTPSQSVSKEPAVDVAFLNIRVVREKLSVFGWDAPAGGFLAEHVAAEFDRSLRAQAYSVGAVNNASSPPTPRSNTLELRYQLAIIVKKKPTSTDIATSREASLMAEIDATAILLIRAPNSARLGWEEVGQFRYSGQPTTFELFVEHAARKLAVAFDTSSAVAALKKPIQVLVPQAFAQNDDSATPTSTATVPSPVASPVKARSLAKGEAQLKSYALILTVANYADKSTTTGANEDHKNVVELFERTFGVPAAQMRLGLDSRASKTFIEKDIGWLQREVPKDGTVFVYFAGHGSVDSSGVPYLMPWDGDVADLKVTAISIEHLRKQLELTKAKRVLLIIDACFSGNSGRTHPSKDRPAVSYDIPPRFKSKVALLAAVSPGETADTTMDGKEGLLTHHLVDALGGLKANRTNGSVLLPSLFSYVKNAVAKDAHEAGRDQTPSLQGDFSDFVIISLIKDEAK